MSSTSAERDYVLGTHADELARLGLQHRVWRPTVLDCWHRAGVTVGSRVLDVGAGPGFASVDLGEIVGPSGSVTAVERSGRFVEAGRRACAAHGLANVRYHERDLMADPLPDGKFDVSWCRWVATFVSSPQLLIKKLSGAVRVGGMAVFHEYCNYGNWSFTPARPYQSEFVQIVMANWRDAGGEPDIGPALLPLLLESGFRLREVVPRVFCIRPRDHMWQWPASFLNTYLDRLLEQGRVEAVWAQGAQREFAEASADPEARMITPIVLEVIAERV